MSTIIVIQEEDIRRIIREVFLESLEQFKVDQTSADIPEPLLGREEISAYLTISLVTLHAWMKQGLPYHKRGRRVYFLRSEVLAYLRKLQ